MPSSFANAVLTPHMGVAYSHVIYSCRAQDVFYWLFQKNVREPSLQVCTILEIN